MSDKNAAIEALFKALETVPPSVVNGSWNKAVAYKQWVSKTKKFATSGRASEAQLRVLLQNYRDF